MPNLKLMGLATDADQIVLNLESASGEKFGAKMSTLDAGSLISGLGRLIEAISRKPTDRSPLMPGMNSVQLIETEAEIRLRISIGDQGLFHDYPVPKNTSLAEDLRFLADRVGAREEAELTHAQFVTLTSKN